MNQGDITGCSVCCETELKMCSLLWAAKWEIWADVLQALLPQVVTSASSQLPSCPSRDNNSTQQAGPRDRDAGEMEGQTTTCWERGGHEPNKENKTSSHEEQIYTMPSFFASPAPSVWS